MDHRVASVGLALALGCSAEPDEAATTFGGDASETASTTTEVGSTTEEPGTDGSTSSTTSTSTSTSTTGDASTTMPEPECGNAMVEGDEECDDGNDSDLDACLTTCVEPTCDDGMLDGDETDVDCGGRCAACALCEGCVFDTDCDTEVCGADDRCTVRERFELDGRDNCWSGPNPFNSAVVIPDLPMGTYLATAVPNSGWAGFPPPWDPPDTGWSWFALCDGVAFTQMRTPGNTRYESASVAFANLMSETESFAWLGGDLACGRADTLCGDNQGTVIFDIELQCPPAE